MGRASLLRAFLRAFLSLLVACITLVSDLQPLAPARVAAHVRVQPPDIAPNQLLIGYQPGTPEAIREALVAQRGGRIVQHLTRISVDLVELPPSNVLGTAAATFADADAVRYVEPNYRYQIAATPDDTRWGDLWGLRAINAPTAWDTTTGSGEVVVGVVDTGIDYTHPDLAANVWTAPSGWNVGGCAVGTHGFRSINGAASCDPADDHGHGTHIAGTIGARGNNGQGVVGVNWQVKLMGLKFLNNQGIGNTSDAIAALDYALATRQAGVNLRVLNLSWGETSPSLSLRAALAQTDAASILVIAAAGNRGTNNDDAPYYPASYGTAPDNLPNIVAVTGINQNGVRPSDFFNYGPNSVHLAAPGVGIWSTAPGVAAYSALDGTSMAAAHVSGAAALLLSAPGFGTLSAAQLKTRLLACGDTMNGAPKTITNRRLNVARALSYSGCATPFLTVTTMAAPPDTGAITVAPAGDTYLAGTVITLTATPQPGYRFSSWKVDGFGGGDSNPLSITVTHDHLIEASFAKEVYVLGLTATAGGQVSATPAAENYAAGTTVELLATPTAGNIFVGWTVDGADFGGVNPLSLTMDHNRNARASFAPVSSPGTTFSLDLATLGTGTVAADPPAGPYDAGSQVTLTATATQGSVFTGWTIDGLPGGTNDTLILTMSANRTVRANFAPAAVLLLSWTQGGNVRTDAAPWSGGSPYPLGTGITLTANPNGDYVFAGWTIDNTFQGWANPLTLTVDGPHTVVANFAKRRHFTDLPPGPPPYEAISQLAARLIILGYNDDTFGPTDTTQRAQMAALIARAMGWGEEDHGNTFTDDLGIDPTLWRNVGTLAHYGVAKGYGDGTFGTVDRVLQAQVISFITRGMVAKGRWVAATTDDPALYPDVPAVSGHRLDLITYHRNAGTIPGTVPTQPWATWSAPATRGWFAEALWQAIDRYFGVDRVP